MVNLATMSKIIRSIRKISRDYVDPEEICPDVMRELRKDQEELSGMIATLPDLKDRIVMAMVFLKYHDFETISEGMGISVRNVFYHMKHGKAELLRMYPERITMS